MSELLNFIRKNWEKIYFCLALLVVVFVYGFVIAENKMAPYSILKKANAAVIDWWKNWRVYMIFPNQKILKESFGSGKGVVVDVPDKTWPGVTFFTGLAGKSIGMQLIDMKGRKLHQWKVSFNKIWPSAAHLDKQPADFSQEILGAKLYENGDVVFNFYRTGIVKIDKCSNVVWKWPFRAHHSVYEDKDGNIWFPSEKKLKKPYEFIYRIMIERPEYIFKVSPDGKLLKAINLLETIKRSQLTTHLLSTGTDWLSLKSTGDEYTHLNAVKILEGPKADAFPLFEPGDIMVSLRNFNMILIIDSKTELVKWSMSEPFLRQHDPEFLDNGHISVFDNRGAYVYGKAYGSSQILDIDPVTKMTSVLYKGTEANPFQTWHKGNHQPLPNGNILITESHHGRIFEVNDKGEIVWSYIDRWDANYTVSVYQSERYPEQYGEFAQEPCP